MHRWSELKVLVESLADPSERLSIQLVDQLPTDLEYAVSAKISLPYNGAESPPPKPVTEKGLPLIMAELELEILRAMLLIQSELGADEAAIYQSLQKIDSLVFALGHLETVWSCLAEQLLVQLEEGGSERCLAELVHRRTNAISERCQNGHYWLP
jgi:hypothetical protein